MELHLTEEFVAELIARAGSAPVRRLALRCPEEAAEALGTSPDYFCKHIRAELRLIRRGRLVFVAVSELERWLETSAARTLA